MPGSNYSGNAANVGGATVISPPVIQVPIDTDPDAAATWTVGMQKAIDYIAQLQPIVNQLQLSSGLPLNETFDGATFPPATPYSAWTAPSARYGSDLAYVRDTSSPITGTASANRPGSQTASQNSSLGLSLFLTTPSRLIFDFQIKCNTGNSDTLDFYVDGTLVGRFSSRSGPTIEAGRMWSDVLREGVHTFDWRFVRGSSSAVSGEQAKIDNVQVISELSWSSDLINKFYLFDDLLESASSNPPNGWSKSTGANAGSVGQSTGGFGITTLAVGAMTLTTAATGTGDWEEVSTVNGIGWAIGSPAGQGITPNRYPFVEGFVGVYSSLTNAAMAFGLAGSNPGAEPLTEELCVVYDSTLGSTWRIQTATAGQGSATVDTGITVTTGLHRIGLSWSPAGILVLIDGKAVPIGTGCITCVAAQVLKTSGLAYGPRVQSASRTAAGTVVVIFDWYRIYALRA